MPVIDTITAASAPPIEGSLRVWWMAQVGMPGGLFHARVFDPEQGMLLLIGLKNYDRFLHENKLRGDHSNAGGLERFEDGEWCEWTDDDGNDVHAVIQSDLAIESEAQAFLEKF